MHTLIHVYLGPLYAMDREVESWNMAFSMVRFLKKSIYAAFGPLISCKLNLDQEEWPRTKKWLCWFF